MIKTDDFFDVTFRYKQRVHVLEGRMEHEITRRCYHLLFEVDRLKQQQRTVQQREKSITAVANRTARKRYGLVHVWWYSLCTNASSYNMHQMIELYKMHTNLHLLVIAFVQFELAFVHLGVLIELYKCKFV